MMSKHQLAVGVGGICGIGLLLLKCRSSPSSFTPVYQSPAYPLPFRVLTSFFGWPVLKKLLLSAPVSAKVTDISLDLPQRRLLVADGVTLFQSAILDDAQVVQMIFCPTALALKPTAVAQATQHGGLPAATQMAADIDRAVDLCSAHAAGKLSTKELVNEGMVTVNYMAVLRLSSGALLLYNPIHLSEQVQAWVRELGGTVKFIVSPLNAHKSFVQEAKQIYPDARVVACQSAAEALAMLPLVTDYVYSEPQDFAELQRALEPEGVTCLFMQGDPHETIVMLHKSSGTLLQADYLYHSAFHAPPKDSGVPANTPFCRAMRTACTCSPNGRVCLYRLDQFNPASPIHWMNRVKGDRETLKVSIEQMLALPFKNVVDCHGGWLKAPDFTAQLRAEYDWL